MSVHFSSPLLARAFEIAQEAHRGQTRADGSPYLQHPLAVLSILEDLAPLVGVSLDDNLRAAALLHDSVEDSDLTLEDLSTQTNAKIAERVDHLTKPDVAKSSDKKTRDAHYYQRLQNEADDHTRLIKVCDRLHNLSELGLTGDPARIDRYQRETRAHFFPLIERMPHAELLRAALSFALTRAKPECPQNVTGLYALIDVSDDDDVEDAVTFASAVCLGGAQVLQLRHKNMSDSRALVFATRLAQVAAQTKALFVVNDRPDIALLARAPFVHLGQSDLDAPDVRAAFSLRTGTSCHTLKDIKAAQKENDYVALGPIFSSRTKQGHADVIGLPPLRAAATLSSVPLVAIGGINSAKDVFDTAEAGAASAAVISALKRAERPRLMAFKMAAAFAMGRASNAARKDDA